MVPVKKSMIIATLLCLVPETLGADSLELELKLKGTATKCIGRHDHGHYCLSIKTESLSSKERTFKYYLKEQLVYNCSSNGHCTEHGDLIKNTRPVYAKDGCSGIPFRMHKPNLLGEYVCIIEDHERRWEASFNLEYCSDMNIPPPLILKLDYEEHPATCVAKSSDYDKFCLSLWLQGQPAKNKAYRCFLDNTLVYNCSSERNCDAHGVLLHNTRPLNLFENCVGIPFSNVLIESTGTITCVLQDDSKLIEAEFDLQFCNEREELQLKLLHNNLEVDCFNDSSSDVSDYCLSLGKGYDQFECWLNGEPVYDLNVNCTERKIYYKQYMNNTCHGISFADTSFLSVSGNYSCTVRTRNAIINNSLVVKTCQRPYENNTDRTNVTEVKDSKDVDKLKSILIPMAVIGVGVIIIIIAFFVMKIYLKKNKAINAQSDDSERSHQPDSSAKLLTTNEHVNSTESDDFHPEKDSLHDLDDNDFYPEKTVYVN